MTRIEAIDVALDVLAVSEGENVAEAVEKLTALKAQIAKKRTTGKPSKKQLESAELKGKIREVLANADEPMTATAIGDAIGSKFQQVSGLIRNMEGVTKTYTEKGKAVYSIAE